METREEVRIVSEEEAAREETLRSLRERTILSRPRATFVGFAEFIRERAVVGLAIGFVLGGAVSKITTSFSNDIVNPILAYIFGGTQRLGDLMIGSVAIGKFIASLLDFFILAFTVYLIFKVLRLDKLDKK